MCSAACFFGLVLGELEEIHAAANVKVGAGNVGLGLRNVQRGRAKETPVEGGWEGEKMDSYVLVSGVSPRIFERLEWRQRVQLTDGNGLPLQNRELEDNMESVVKFLHENRWASPPCHLVQ